MPVCVHLYTRVNRIIVHKAERRAHKDLEDEKWRECARCQLKVALPVLSRLRGVGSELG